MTAITITNGTTNLEARLYEAGQAHTLLVIASATGVRQEFYNKFADYLSEKGITVITFDYSGIGQSLQQPIREIEGRLSDWGSKDLEAVIGYTLSHYADLRKVLLGHSIGGQLIGLAPSAVLMDKIILVAAQSGYWKYWKGIQRTKMWFNWHVLFPVLTNLFGYLPSKKVNGMENLPKNVADQWRRWGTHHKYMLGDPTIGAHYYEQIRSELIAFSMADDPLAPKPAVEWMTNIYTNAQTKRIHLYPRDHGAGKIGHFGIFKERFEPTLWKMMLKEIEQLQP